MSKYTKWTKDLTSKAQFLLRVYRDYNKVADILSISPTALKSRNNKHWKIDCKTIWNEYNDYMLNEFLRAGLSKKEIGNAFGVTENAISIRLSQLKK